MFLVNRKLCLQINWYRLKFNSITHVTHEAKTKNFKNTKRYLNETMFENQEWQMCMCLHIFRTSVNYLILALSWNECNIMLLIIHWILYTDYLCILYYLPTLTILIQPPEQNSEAAAKGALKTFENFSWKQLCWSLFSTKLQTFCNFTKRRLLHRCFPVKFEKF